jgi:serine/threonine-protein kinase
MGSIPEPANEREQRVQEILADYLEAEEAGARPERSEWFARYPEFAAELEKFFRDHDQAKRLAPAPAPVRSPSDDSTGPERPDAADPDLDTIRYFGDYELLAKLGEGGMGRVYKARQKSLDRLVALKMMTRAGAEDRQRFQIETRAVAALDHPNIVPIYEVGEHDGQPYFTMKYLEGGSLKDRQQEWRLPGGSAGTSEAKADGSSGTAPLQDREQQIAQFMATVARAVHHAHQRGILHRDLKPGNILLTGRVPHLSDFGLAKTTGSESDPTVSGAILGTPAYMAPEQAEGRTRDVTTLADVYSLGTILYELLTGQPPFRGKSPQEIIRKRLQDQVPPAPRKLNEAVPRDLETICLKCLQVNPKKRYASAEELALDLERFLNREPIKARRVGLLERAWLWCRRHPREVALTTAAVVVVLVALVAWIWIRSDQEQERAVRAAETKRQAHTALEEAAGLQGQARATGDLQTWSLAVRAADRAATLLEGEVQDPVLLEQARSRRAELEKEERQAQALDAARKRDRRMLARLEECRFLKTMMKGDGFDTTAAVAGYEEAFREYGLDPDKLSVQEAVARVKASPIRADLAAGLDEWGLLCVDVKFKRMMGMLADAPKVNAERTPWLFEVARIADTGDPWRNTLRATLTRPNLFTIGSDLAKLARSADVVKVPPPSLALLGECLGNLGNPREAVVFLRRAQEQHPGDPWLAYWLALHLTQQRPTDWDEAIRFWQAAYACCPTHAGMIFNIGWALDNKGDFPGAVKAYRKAIELRPDYPMAHQNLGITLASMYAWDEGVASIRQAIRLRPKYAQAHFMLGFVRRFQGAYAEARDALQTCQKLVGKTHGLWPQAESLRKECEQRLAAVDRLPRLLDGDLQPQDTDEAQLFAEVCFFQEYYLESARLYDGVFATKKDAIDYLAVCAAARAGAGQGKDAALADAAERARWRGKALAWLTAELPRIAKQREDPVFRKRIMARYQLLRFKSDPHLAGIRDAAALAALPPEEQQACRALWARVDETLAALVKR